MRGVERGEGGGAMGRESSKKADGEKNASDAIRARAGCEAPFAHPYTHAVGRPNEHHKSNRGGRSLASPPISAQPGCFAGDRYFDDAIRKLDSESSFSSDQM